MVATSRRRRPKLVVDVGQPDPRALGGEEAGLGGEVVVDVGVEVEVVATEVEEGRDVEDDAVDPAHHERVAGDLHRAGVDAALAHHREEAVEVGRLGRGQLGLDVLAGDAGADGPDHGGGDAGRRQALLEDAGGRGLALGAGDADDAQAGGGVAVDPGGEAPQHAARLGDDDRRGAGRQPVEPGRVGQHADGPGSEGLAGEVGTVGTRAREGGVQVTGADPRGAQRDAGHRHVEVAVDGDVDALAQPVGERGGRRRGHPARSRRAHGLLGLIHRPSVSTHHSTGSRDGVPLVGSTP